MAITVLKLDKYYNCLVIKNIALVITSDVPDPDPDFFSNQDPAGTESRQFFKIRIRPEPDPDFFFKLRSGRIRILDKNGNIRPDPDPDSESGTSLIITKFKF